RNEKTSISLDNIFTEASSSLFITLRGKKELEKLKSMRKIFLDDYILLDTIDNPVKLSDFKDKIVLIDFYFTGCGGCALLYSQVLSEVKDHFQDDDDILFITISADKDRNFWISGIERGIYTSKGK